jgi:hypothetical protein
MIPDMARSATVDGSSLVIGCRTHLSPALRTAARLGSGHSIPCLSALIRFFRAAIASFRRVPL